MRRRMRWHRLGEACVVMAVLVACRSGARAQDGGADCGSCGNGCCGMVNKGHCPPKFIHYMERPPCIKYKCACPKPVCDPCHLPHFGYYQPCWQPWPFPPDWSHCQVPPPGALVPALPPGARVREGEPEFEKSPPPRPLEPGRS